MITVGGSYINDEKKRKYADAIEELLKSRSYDKISVNDICDKVGAYRPNFYYHFKNKDDLINWIFLRDYDTKEFIDRGEVYRHTVFLTRIKKHASFYIKIVGGSTNCEYYNFIKSMFKEYACELYSVEQDELDDIDRFKLEYAASSYVMTVYEWLSGNINMSTEQFAVFLVDNIKSIHHKRIG